MPLEPAETRSRSNFPDSKVAFPRYTGAPNGNFRKNPKISVRKTRFENYNFRSICCKISCLPASPRIFEHLQNGIITHFKRIFTLKRPPRIFENLFLAEIFEKVSFDPYNFRITRLSARKSEQMKSFWGIKICLYLPFKY